MSEGGDHAEDIARERRRESRDLRIGFAMAIVLTGAGFAIAAARPFATRLSLVLLAVLAFAQIAAQFRYFLHIDLQRSHRDDLQLILFTGLVTFLMIAGTIWILFDQYSRMG